MLLPGSLTSPCVYDEIHINSNYQIAVIDYCTSSPEWDVMSLGKRIVELIRDKSLIDTVLVGYSAGGVIAMATAIQADGLIKGMMLSNTGPYGKNHGDPKFPQKILEHWGEESFKNDFLGRCFSKPIPSELNTKLLDYMDEIDINAAYTISKSLREVDLREKLKKINYPVVILHGTKDKSRTLEHVKMMTDNLHHAEVFLVDVGHTVVIENNEKWNECLNFLLDKINY